MPEHIKKKLQDEIKQLEYELTTELPAEIKKARAMGDLSENAEYHMAKQRQEFVNARPVSYTHLYFNIDVGVSGPDFTASAVPSLKEFVRDIARSVPSPLGGSVYRLWHLKPALDSEHRQSNAPPVLGEEVHLGLSLIHI